MIIFYSGGSPICETGLPKPTVMLSYYVITGKKTEKVDGKTATIEGKGRPDSRSRTIMEIRKKARLTKKGKPCPTKAKKSKGRRSRTKSAGKTSSSR